MIPGHGRRPDPAPPAGRSGPRSGRRAAAPDDSTAEIWVPPGNTAEVEGQAGDDRPEGAPAAGIVRNGRGQAARRAGPVRIDYLGREGPGDEHRAIRLTCRAATRPPAPRSGRGPAPSPRPSTTAPVGSGGSSPAGNLRLSGSGGDRAATVARPGMTRQLVEDQSSPWPWMNCMA